MKVLMLCEYFPPFDSGGSEWSTFYLAKGIKEKKINSAVLTPNYGKAPKREHIEDIEVIRFPFYKKLGSKKQLTPYWHTNTLWFVYTCVVTLYWAIKTKADIIHVQGKYFLPAAIIAKVFTGKKVVLTARDYILLCPLGMCLMYGEKPCRFNSFIFSDFPKYIQNYLPNASKPRAFLQFIFCIRARIISQILKTFLGFVDKKVTISAVSKNIYEKAGVKNITVIPNSFDFHSKVNSNQNLKSPTVIYAGRLTLGKGAQIFLDAIPIVLKSIPGCSFVIAGEGNNKNDLIKQVHKSKIGKKVKFLGHISHSNLLERLSTANCTVMPSLWPEPFGRIALEAIGVGTPVVISSHAGISEQVSNRWGRVVEPKAKTIAGGIIFTIKNHQKLRKNILDDQEKIKKIWSINISNSYANIYNELKK